MPFDRLRAHQPGHRRSGPRPGRGLVMIDEVIRRLPHRRPRADPVRGQAGRRRPGPDGRADAGRACWPAATSCSRACPGVAKTLAVRTLADVVGGSFSRLQFTPDLMPADIVGTQVWRPSTERFDTELGPVFANLVLADEINRAPAKVQSALLEAMAERQVSIGGTTHRLPVAVPGAGHPEPDRDRGRLHAARGAAGPVPAQGRRRPRRRARRADHRAADERRPAPGAAGSSTIEDLVDAAGGDRPRCSSTTPSRTTRSSW